MNFLRENWLIILVVLSVLFFLSWAVKYAIKIFAGPGTPELEKINEKERKEKETSLEAAQRGKEAAEEEHHSAVDKLDKNEVDPSEIFNKEIKK